MNEQNGTGVVKWFQFERDVYSLMGALGFSVQHVSAAKAGDGGVDVYASKGDDLEEVNWVIQCKCWRRKVGPSVVQNLIGALADYPAGTRGMIVTTSMFTRQANEKADKHNIRLMDGTEFLERINK
ncbi:MAG TPA: restriction endonuclease [Gemmataceae bacterium]|nr:restriction endonuclease [Gemmataceae bacterium]